MIGVREQLPVEHPERSKEMQEITAVINRIKSRGIHQLIDDDGDTYVTVEKTADEDKVRIYTAGTERVIIDNSGKVGIGTTTPEGKLHVYTSGPLGSTADNSMTLSSQAGGAGSGNIVRLRTSLYRKSAGSDWTTAVLLLWRFTDGTSQVYIAIDSNNVGIGTVNPGYLLDVNGACHASSFPTTSDKRFKKNITPIINALDKIRQINGISFRWNEQYAKAGRKPDPADKETQLGIVAQDLEAIVPEVISEWQGEDGVKYKGIDYTRLVPLLIEGIKELEEKLNDSLRR